MQYRGFALWILTKFAMLFFIFALAAVMLSLGNSQQTAACDSQAQNTVNAIAAKISQVIYSPAEDEKAVFAFQSVLPLGAGGTRYDLNISYRTKASVAPPTSFLSFDLRPLSQLDCSGANSLSLGEASAYRVVYYDSRPVEARDRDSIKFVPSEAKDPSKRSHYLVVLKCSVKQPGGQKYIFLQNCRADTADRCDLSLESPFIASCCGWEAGTPACNFS